MNTPWVAERQPDPGQVWKCGDEFLPFHPQASHVPPDYRDGWNRCYYMALERGASRPVECWGLSDMCAELNQKCRAKGKCVVAPERASVVNKQEVK